MLNGYSKDLRNRVSASSDDNHTQTQTCEVFKISRSTLNWWLKLRCEIGSADLRHRPKTCDSRKIDEQKLKKYIESHPDVRLHEIATEFKVSQSAIWHACDRYRITQKNSFVPEIEHHYDHHI